MHILYYIPSSTNIKLQFIYKPPSISHTSLWHRYNKIWKENSWSWTSIYMKADGQVKKCKCAHIYPTSHTHNHLQEVWFFRQRIGGNFLSFINVQGGSNKIFCVVLYYMMILDEIWMIEIGVLKFQLFSYDVSNKIKICRAVHS